MATGMQAQKFRSPLLVAAGVRAVLGVGVIALLAMLFVLGRALSKRRA